MGAGTTLVRVMTRTATSLVAIALTVGALPAVAAEPSLTVDLATVSVADGLLLRLHGRAGNGAFGVPVAASADCDGDGLNDLAMSSMLADPSGRSDAGEVHVIFGDGSTAGAIDAAVLQPNLLRVIGDGSLELTGSEVWLDDVTGDGIADVLIAQQNRRADADRPGAGGVTILVGGPELRAQAETLEALDLRVPPQQTVVTTILGANAIDRFGVWLRTGDVTGDGISDIAVGADQEDLSGSNDNGALYLIRGGPHLALGAVIDLDELAASPLAGHVARVLPPAGSNEYHFGSTCQIADLDGNGRGELMGAAALNRFNCTIEAEGAPDGSAHPTGGPADGRLFIVWDDNFPEGAWPSEFVFATDAAPGSVSTISGATPNVSFGEEIVGGFDADNDGRSDLFVGDLVGNPTGSRPQSGAGYVFYDAASLKGLAVALDTPPAALTFTTILGGSAGEIAGDTAATGDFDGDGIADLALSAPHAEPLGRRDAGTITVLMGRNGPWPATIDLLAGSLPDATAARVVQIHGAQGTAGSDAGDVLAYSAAGGDVDGDGRDDIVTNEMMGNGTSAAAEDVGNMLAISGTLIVGPDAPPSCTPDPGLQCRAAAGGQSFVRMVDAATPLGNRFGWLWRATAVGDVADFFDPLGTPTASYRVCVYERSEPERPVAQGVVSAGGTCAGAPCWRSLDDEGYVFDDPAASRDGIARLKLRTGENAGTLVRLRARGPGLRAAVPPLTLPVTVRFLAARGGEVECWEAVYATANRNEPGLFKTPKP